MARPMDIANDLANVLDPLLNAGALDVSAVRVPVLERKDISGIKILVSPASRAFAERTRGSRDDLIDIDIALINPLGTTPNDACTEIEDLADSVIDLTRSMEFDVSGSPAKVVSVSQPVLIDAGYYRQENLAVSVVRLTIRYRP